MLSLQIRPRDFCWASEGDVVPLTEYLEELRVSLSVQQAASAHVYLRFYAFVSLTSAAALISCCIAFVFPAI